MDNKPLIIFKSKKIYTKQQIDSFKDWFGDAGVKVVVILQDFIIEKIITPNGEVL